MNFACGSLSALETQEVHVPDYSAPFSTKLPTAAQTAQPWRDEDPNRFLRIVADFDGDGFDEVATLLINETYTTPTLNVRVEGPDEPNPRLSKRLRFELAFDKLAVTGIRLVEAGVYEIACDECRPGERKKTLTLERPAISIFELEGAETIFYWDIETQSYLGVEMGRSE